LAATAFLITGPVAGMARADEGRTVTSAEAEVFKDNEQVFDDAFRIVESDSEVLDGNYAFAHAKGCESCQAVAISFQIVLVQEPPDVLKPENLAVAYNEECTSCVAAAGAYQFVVGGRPVRLTDSGRQQLKSIRKDVDALESSGQSGTAMVESANVLAGKVREVLRTELRPSDDDEKGEGKARVEERRMNEDGPNGRIESAETYEIDD